MTESASPHNQPGNDQGERADADSSFKRPPAEEHTAPHEPLRDNMLEYDVPKQKRRRGLVIGSIVAAAAMGIGVGVGVKASGGEDAEASVRPDTTSSAPASPDSGETADQPQPTETTLFESFPQIDPIEVIDSQAERDRLYETYMSPVDAATLRPLVDEEFADQLSYESDDVANFLSNSGLRLYQNDDLLADTYDTNYAAASEIFGQPLSLIDPDYAKQQTKRLSLGASMQDIDRAIESGSATELVKAWLSDTFNTFSIANNITINEIIASKGNHPQSLDTLSDMAALGYSGQMAEEWRTALRTSADQYVADYLINPTDLENRKITLGEAEITDVKVLSVDTEYFDTLSTSSGEPHSWTTAVLWVKQGHAAGPDTSAILKTAILPSLPSNDGTGSHSKAIIFNAHYLDDQVNTLGH